MYEINNQSKFFYIKKFAFFIAICYNVITNNVRSFISIKGELL